MKPNTKARNIRVNPCAGPAINEVVSFNSEDDRNDDHGFPRKEDFHVRLILIFVLLNRTSGVIFQFAL